jgi:nicotinamide-nucleotide amidase
MSDLKSLMLSPPPLTLAVAESLTAGRLQARISSISGASDFFLGGITSYSIESKVSHLGVNRLAAEAVNCVSAPVAEQMASGACALFGADLAASTTGYAEPSPARSIKDPFAWWAISHRQSNGTYQVQSGRIECPGATRAEAQDLVTEAALAALLAHLREFRTKARG